MRDPLGFRRFGSLVALGAVMAVALTGCSGSSNGSESTSSTVGAAARSSSTAAVAAVTCGESDGCTLGEAATAAEVRIGTAGKWSSPERIALQAEQFTALTDENEGLWNVIHPAPDRYDWSGMDRVADFAERHDMELTFTHFLWDPPSLPEVVPDWVRAESDPDRLRAVLRAHLRALAQHYGDRVDRLNVVNEPLTYGGELETHNHYEQVLGPGYIAEAFTMAEEEWPGAKRILNENLIEYSPAKADALVALVKQLLADKVPIDGVGLQAHFFAGPPNLDLLATTIERLGALGVDVALTEIDVPLLGPQDTLDSQAELAAGAVRACLVVPQCSSITFWGFDDGDTWLDSFLRPGTKPLLYDADLAPKPMYDAVLAVLRAGRP